MNLLANHTYRLSLLFLFVGLFSLTTLNGQNAEARKQFIGAWSGSLATPGAALDLGFDIKYESEKWSATIDVPAQGVKGFNASEVVVTGQEITIQFSAFQASYTGSLDAAGEKLTGKWAQGGMSLDLVMERSSGDKVLNRPQVPKAPFPYTSEEVSYINEADKLSLAGTLTLPKTAGPHAVVILISGSGPQNRDEELMGHKPFLVLSDYLTRQGIAVLRYDDRGVGKSTGNFTGATSLDFSRDVMAGIAYLKTRKEIDATKIGLVGHSEGGLIAPMVASKSKDVSFIVLLAGPGIKCDELLIQQQGLIGRSMGKPEAAIKKDSIQNEKVYEIVKKDLSAMERRSALIAFLKPEFDTLSAAEQEAKGGSVEASVDQLLGQVGGPWFRYFLNFDPAVYLTKVSCPTLAVNGGKDLQVPAKVNLEGIKTSLEKAPCKVFEIKEFPEMNHLFQTAKTGAVAEYYQIEETFAPAAMTFVGNWILEQTR
ncbi:MAG: alpha/beta hydrolase family protein [Saprospiraceae bacterium]